MNKVEAKVEISTTEPQLEIKQKLATLAVEQSRPKLTITPRGYVVVEVGSFLGVGEKSIVVPVGKIRIEGGGLVPLLTVRSEEDFDEMSAYRPADFDPAER